MNQYEVYWLQELRGGKIGGQYGDPVTELGELPINETLAARIRSLAPPGGGNRVSLHFPFLNLRERQEWPAAQLRLPVTAVEPNRIMIGDSAAHQFGGLS